MKIKKKMIISIAFLVLFFALHTIVYADAWDVSDFDTLISEGKNDTAVINSTKSIMGTIINVIRIVGTGVSAIMLTYVAIKYMSAAPSEKAEFKKSATAFIVGAVVLFAATNLLKILADFAVENISAK